MHMSQLKIILMTQKTVSVKNWSRYLITSIHTIWDFCEEIIMKSWRDKIFSKWQWRMRAELTLWSKVFHEKLTGFHLVKKFPTLYGSWRLIAMFTRAGYFSLPWSWSIQLMPYQPISLRSFLILSSHLSQGLPSGLFSSGFPTITLYAPVLFPIILSYLIHLILLDLVTRTIFDEECRP
jgi:hypothetical protein